ncbi:MAG: hypothetical protein MUP82_10350 [Candidatus Marinimicrobia bacterium]|nr:hypothetical protein [Candidatus Neomarinimicrobiota bacterium]
MITLSRVKQATNKFVKILRFGKSDVQTSEQYAPAGIDSKPISDQLAIQSTTSDKSETIILGYKITGSQTNEGETRIFSTDSDGNEVFSILLKNDGTCEFGGDVDNMVRFSKLEEAYNQLKDDHDSLVSTFNSHIHITTATIGPTPTPGTIAPTTTTETPSTGDISGAKIDEIKTL